MADDGFIINIAPVDSSTTALAARRKQKQDFRKGKLWKNRKALAREQAAGNQEDSTVKNTDKKSQAMGEETSSEYKKAKPSVNGTAPGTATPAGKQIISSLFTKNPEIPSLPRAPPDQEQRVSSNAVLDTSSFTGIGLDPNIVKYLDTKMDIKKPTAIQQNAMPALIGGNMLEIKSEHDVFIQAATGSGKTLTYLLPVFHRLVQAGLAASYSSAPSRDMGTFAIILTPTRELAQQVYEAALKLTAAIIPSHSWESVGWIVPGIVIGGDKKQSEKNRLRKGVGILACTPGRLLDHLENTTAFNVENLRWLVLDEADRLMELGFEETLTKILALLDSKANKRFQGTDRRVNAMSALLPNRRINVLCSATLRDNVKQLANESLVNPVFISASKVYDNIEQAAEEAHKGKRKRNSDENMDVQMTQDSSDAKDCDAVDTENFTVPSQLVQKSVIIPAKLRLITLVAQLKNTFRKKSTSKLIVFLSCKDSVDFMYFLFAHDDNQSYVDDLFKSLDGGSESEDDSSSEKGGSAKKRELPDKTGPRLNDDETVLDSTVLPGAKLFRLHGGMQQKNRTETFSAFSKSSMASILFTTDVAARGLDLPNVTSIIQFDPPSDVASYLHRVGRTARLGRVGEAILFLLPSESGYLALLQEKGLRPDDESMESVLKQMAKNEGAGKGGEWQLRAGEAQAMLERFVASNITGSRLAKQAFLSSIRAYATHISAERHIFHVRHLHFGHLAKAFALRETPNQVATGKGNNQKAADARSEKKKKKELAGKKKPTLKRGNDINEFAVGNIGAYYAPRANKHGNGSEDDMDFD
ncbi:P-loop containing nucleoside triphosphate hydrolase protein [Coemansia spiralis]|nr:P-loop containing nucleoside triphosphate hydrolase protein [Coemansia spiralis]